MTPAGTSSGGAPARFRKRALGATLAVHAGLFALLLAPTAERARPVSRSLAVFDVAGPDLRAAPEPPKPRQPRPVPPTPPQPVVVPPPVVPPAVPNAMVVALLEQADAAASGGACDLTAPVQAALRTSPAVMHSLPRIPRDQRSVANAIMVWNASWITPDSAADQAPFDAIRDVVAGTVAAASEACRVQAQGGPRLIMLPGASDTVVLALGSGTWRWQDVVDSARAGDAPVEVADAGAPPFLFAALGRAVARGNETNGFRQQPVAVAIRP